MSDQKPKGLQTASSPSWTQSLFLDVPCPFLLLLFPLLLFLLLLLLPLLYSSLQLGLTV